MIQLCAIKLKNYVIKFVTKSRINKNDLIILNIAIINNEIRL